MKKHEEDAKTIEEAFEIILYACENIKDFEQCHDCPMHHLCLDDPETSVLDLGDLISKDSWAEFLEYSESATWSDEVLYAYLCTGLTAGEQCFDENETLDTEEHDINELVNMVMSGEICANSSAHLVLKVSVNYYG